MRDKLWVIYVGVFFMFWVAMATASFLCVRQVAKTVLATTLAQETEAQRYYLVDSTDLTEVRLPDVAAIIGLTDTGRAVIDLEHYSAVDLVYRDLVVHLTWGAE